MSHKKTTDKAPAATFGQYFSNFDREAENIGSFHNAMTHFGISFPSSVSALMEGISFGAVDDADVQSNAAVFAGLMLELGGYIIAALENYPAAAEAA